MTVGAVNLVSTQASARMVLDMDESLVVFPRERVLSLARITPRQLDYWAATGLIAPTIARRVTPHRTVRLYDYGDLMSILIIVELHSRGKSVQYIRQIVQHAQSLGFQIPELVFAVEGSRVHFQTPDGVWQDADRPQTISTEALKLAPLRARIKESIKREPGQVGEVERRRGALGMKPVIAGTRIPVDAVRRFLERGTPVAEILEAYPSLQAEDVEAVQHLASA